MLRGGLTDSGGKAAASHTGAMAGSAAVYEAAARQAGLVTCTSVQEALDLTTALANLPLPSGRRIAIVTNGGGAGVLAADEMARRQLTLVDPPAELLAEIDEILPPFWSRRNPFDMVAMAGGDVGPRVLAAVARCPEVDAVVVLSVLGVPNTGDEVRGQAATGDYEDFSPWEQRYLDGVAALMAETGKPIVNVPDLPIRRAVYTGDHRYAPVVVPTPRAAALVLERMARYGAWRSSALRPLPTEGRRMTPPDVAAAEAKPDAPELVILSGNEAIARGAWEAGVRFASAYPGTPSTEIMEALAKYEDVYAEWAPNEKVAVEAATGAALAGARALATMKHVGLNVGADPFFSSSMIHMAGGLVIVSADDPAMHSSQDEQDNRTYAKFAKMAMVEPSDADEALQFIKAAYEMSERFGTSVLFRTTTRTSHAQGVARFGERVTPAGPLLELERDPSQQLMMPHNAIPRHAAVEQRLLDLAEFAETTELNRVEMGDARVGIVASGAAYGYAKEAFPQAQLPQAGHELAAAQAADRRLPRQGREAVRGGGARPVPRGEHPPAGRDGRRRQGHPAAVRRVQPRPRGQDALRGRCPRRGREPAAGRAGGRRGPARQAADALPRLLAPRRLRGAAPPARLRERRHRLLQPRRAGAVQRHALQHLHGRRHQHGARHGEGPGRRAPTPRTAPSRSSATAPSSTPASRPCWTSPTTAATSSP